MLQISERGTATREFCDNEVHMIRKFNEFGDTEISFPSYVMVGSQRTASTSLTWNLAQ